MEEFAGALGRQRVEAQLGEVRPPSPGMLILGPIVDEEENTRGRQALDEGIEERLGLAVDPMEVLDDQQERPRLTFPQQQARDGVERALTTLGRVEGLPAEVAGWDVQQRQEGRRERLERAVERQERAAHIIANVAALVPVLDLEVRSEEVNDRQIAGRLPVRDGPAFENMPALCEVRVDELVKEAGLSDTRLADARHRLPIALAGTLEGTTELLQLGLSSNKSSEAPGCCGLEPRPHRPLAGDLIDLDRLGQTFYGYAAERFDAQIPFGKA